jgi:hypothetical protein
MTTEKATISSKLRELEKKLGHLVFTFNSNRRMMGSCQGWLDHVVINTRKLCIWFIEVKIGRDQLSARQQLLKWTLMKLEQLMPADGRVVCYRVVNEKNIDMIIDEIVQS